MIPVRAAPPRQPARGRGGAVVDLPRAAVRRAVRLAVLRRAVQLASLSGGFVASLFLDKLLKREEQMVDQRSKELLNVVLALGPTFIKIGQALSIRQDILPAAYAAGLQELQDNVPPFSAAQGRAVIERELGIRLSDTFSEFSLEPIAAASIVRSWLRACMCGNHPKPAPSPKTRAVLPRGAGVHTKRSANAAAPPSARTTPRTARTQRGQHEKRAAHHALARSSWRAVATACRAESFGASAAAAAAGTSPSAT